MKQQTPTEHLCYRIRMWQPTNDSNLDLLYDAADHMTLLARERDAADARVKVLEAELITTRALMDERKVA